MPHRHSSWRFCTASWFILTFVMPGSPLEHLPFIAQIWQQFPVPKPPNLLAILFKKAISTVKKHKPVSTSWGRFRGNGTHPFLGARLWRHAHLCLLEASGKVLAGEQAMQARRSPKPEAFSWRWRRERAREVFLESESTF